MTHPVLRATISACMFLLCIPCAFPQKNASADCSFEDGMQMSIRYHPVSSKKAAKKGAVWAPGDKPITLFTQTGLNIGNANLPAGAYTLYLIPNDEAWTLVVNKNVQDPAKYDEKQDLARVQMPRAELNKPVDQLSLTLAKMGASQCNLRVYYGKTGAYGAEFKEQSGAASAGSSR